MTHVGPMLPAAGALFFGATVGSLCLTSFTDPGILPRGPPDTADPPVVTREVWYQQRRLQLKWCHTCKIWRPPRASHCNSCDNCVLAFDHHCPFVGNCIGIRNYGAFSTFLTSLQGLIVSVLVGFVLSSTEAERSRIYSHAGFRCALMVKSFTA